MFSTKIVIVFLSKCSKERRKKSLMFPRGLLTSEFFDSWLIIADYRYKREKKVVRNKITIVTRKINNLIGKQLIN